MGLSNNEVDKMRISTKGRYSLRMLLDLAEHSESGAVALGDVAKRQEISKKYLEQIIPIFNNSGILRANRGSQGGYMLAKPASQITVGDVLRLTEGTLAPVDCAAEDPAECARSADCYTLPVWQGLYRLISDYLDGITLQTLLDQKKERDGYDYVI